MLFEKGANRFGTPLRLGWMRLLLLDWQNSYNCNFPLETVTGGREGIDLLVNFRLAEGGDTRTQRAAVKMEMLVQSPGRRLSRHPNTRTSPFQLSGHSRGTLKEFLHHRDCLRTRTLIMKMIVYGTKLCTETEGRCPTTRTRGWKWATCERRLPSHTERIKTDFRVKTHWSSRNYPRIRRTFW